MQLIRGYLQDHKIKVLSKEAVYDLIAKAQKGCLKSRDLVVVHNLPLVLRVSKRYFYTATSTVSFDDLFQEGVLGLMRAIELFDLKRGLHFSTYAEPWIRQKVLRYHEDNRGPVRTPVYLQQLFRKYRKLKNEDENIQKTDDFYIQAVARSNSCSVSGLRRAITFQPSEVCIDDPLDLHQLSDIVDEDKMNLALFDFKHMLSLLEPREKFIIEKRMTSWTLQQIAVSLEVSRERVRQLETGAMLKLRAMISDVRKHDVFEVRDNLNKLNSKKSSAENIIDYEASDSARKTAKKLEEKLAKELQASKRDRRVLSF